MERTQAPRAHGPFATPQHPHPHRRRRCLGLLCRTSGSRKRSSHQIHIVEKGSQVLTKVRISGGGRCNVTHACFEPRELASHYPRGQKELLGPFHQWQSSDTVSWFMDRGIALKTEPDGRMFPITDLSSTIVDCLENEARSKGIVDTQKEVVNLWPADSVIGRFSSKTMAPSGPTVLMGGGGMQSGKSSA